MRYLYKIYSPYDGFTPSQIPHRLEDGRFLTLGWEKYLDAVNLHDEVWVVFTGPRFPNGVYVQGLVASIDRGNSQIRLRVRRSSTTNELTDAATSLALRQAVAVRNRQVFSWPADRQLRNQCHLNDCDNRQCRACDVWGSLPQIDPAHFVAPAALRGIEVVPAYWITPARCFLYYHSRQPAPWVRSATEMFGSFKVGEKRYAYPLAAGIAAAFTARNLGGFDAIVPVPLSPEKIAAGELDRTSALADELALLIQSPVRKFLSLSNPISKRRMVAQGYTPTQFKARYRQYLDVDAAIAGVQRILVVDDVITKGSTLAVVVAAIQAANPTAEITVASAGQMIVMAAVANRNGPAW